MPSFVEMYYAVKNKSKNEPYTSQNRHEILKNRLYCIYEKECKNFVGNYLMSFRNYFGYDENLINDIPNFALDVLEKISDKDIIIATRSVLLGITTCPNCGENVDPVLKNCAKCYANLPKDSIFFKGINVMSVTAETRNLLKTIATTQITVAGNLKTLELLKEKVSNEIIASLMNEVLHCPDCGMKIVPSNARYCWNCGSEFEKQYRQQIEDNVVVTLPLNDNVIALLNKLAMEELKEIDEYSGGIDIQDFCDTLIENEIASAALCKKLGVLSAKIENYYEAIDYYNKAMEIDPSLDLWSQIERLEKKIEKGY